MTRITTSLHAFLMRNNMLMEIGFNKPTVMDVIGARNSEAIKKFKLKDRTIEAIKLLTEHKPL